MQNNLNEMLVEKDEPNVIINSEVLQEIRIHAREFMNEEICGVLIGKKEGNNTTVTARIAGNGAAQAGANVTFTQEAWENIYKTKDSKYPNDLIVGWYHSHPGFGIFLSEYDLFIHNNFFSSKHQLAWVYDPHSEDEGCFGWVAEKVISLDKITIIQKKRLFDSDVNALLDKEKKSTQVEIDGGNEVKITASNLANITKKQKVIISIVVTSLLILDISIITYNYKKIIKITNQGIKAITTSLVNVTHKK